MKMVANLVVLVVALLGMRAQVDGHPKGCKHHTVIQQMEWERLQGRWYDAMHTPLCSDCFQKCMMTQISVDGQELRIRHMTQTLTLGAHEKVTGYGITPENPQGRIRLTIHQDGNTYFNVLGEVLATDFDNYAVVHFCEPITGFEGTYISSRHQTLPSRYYSQIYQVLQLNSLPTPSQLVLEYCPAVPPDPIY